MMWVVGLVVVVAIGMIAVIAVGRSDELGEVYDDRPDSTVAIGRPLTADDLHDVRFSTAVRGYRMDEVDALLARVEADLLARKRHDAPLSEPAPVPADDQGDFHETGASGSHEGGASQPHSIPEERERP